MEHRITLLPGKQNISAPSGSNLLEVLRENGILADAPCGGRGTCGKCAVTVDGWEMLACRCSVDRDLTVRLPRRTAAQLLAEGVAHRGEFSPARKGWLLALDIGTTTVVGYFLDPADGREVASYSLRNPQTAYGADVISRIRYALQGHMEALCRSIRECVTEITLALCEKAGILPQQIGVVSLVGNPAMQQLFLGILPDNLARLPFGPVLNKGELADAAGYIPLWENALLAVVPDISGFVGADTVAGILATGLDEQEELSLLVDIGTNGEMVLGNKNRMVACSAAAGPALEGANIRFGMRGQAGAIDHVWIEKGEFCCSVIGGGEPEGICGSGIIDGVAAALELQLVNERGRILTEDRQLRLTDRIFLTQEDIRQVQLAKGAIAAGIEAMTAHLGVSPEQIRRVYLAGAFGTYLEPASACRIALLPAALEGRITAVGNAAGSGAKQIACSTRALSRAQTLAENTEFLELAAAPGFQRCFAKHMRF